jgi:ABC-type transporter Mla subunit MlaD
MGLNRLEQIAKRYHDNDRDIFSARADIAYLLERLEKAESALRDIAQALPPNALSMNASVYFQQVEGV